MPTSRGRGQRPLALLSLSLAAVLAATFARRWLDAVEVRGDSMAPSLLPGELLLVERVTLALRRPRAGEVVLAGDPREPGRELVKRVAAYDPRTGLVDLRGDAPERSADSRTFGSIPVGEIRWRAALRYWPPQRWRRL